MALRQTRDPDHMKFAALQLIKVGACLYSRIKDSGESRLGSIPAKVLHLGLLQGLLQGQDFTL